MINDIINFFMRLPFSAFVSLNMWLRPDNPNQHALKGPSNTDESGFFAEIIDSIFQGEIKLILRVRPGAGGQPPGVIGSKAQG